MRDRDRQDKRVGTVVDGRWRVDGVLGYGSTSAVYAATHRNGHRAALKILHPPLCSDPATIERFLQEAGIVNAIRHRAIVPIRDDGMTDDGCVYLVVELLEGETLEAIRERKKGRIDLEEFATIGEELMSAIAAVHAAGIVHRDLKPQNVFVTTSGGLKLLDFGTARIRAASAALAEEVVGTPGFMAPEQARGDRDEVDAQSDVWSLGALIFTVLSGEPVHAGPDPHARVLAAASTPARRLGDVAPSIDDRVAMVIDRALAFAKQDRWPDVQTMRIAFRHAVMAAVPTMRDLEVHGGAREEADLSPQTGSSFGPPPPPMPVPVRDVATESGVLSVSSSKAPRVAREGIPRRPLAVGAGAAVSVALLLMLFAPKSEPRTQGVASPVETAATPPPFVAAPADSFIVISAPDVPAPVEAKKQERPAWAARAPVPRRAVDARQMATSELSPGGRAWAGGDTEDPAPEGNDAPGASDAAAP